MPLTTAYSFGDVVLVPFPFTDQTGLKKRPAVIVSSAEYQAQRRDLVIMAITSQIRPRPAFGEFTVTDWKKAGLIAPSAVKPVLTTIEKRLVLKKLGQLQQVDVRALRTSLDQILTTLCRPAGSSRAASGEAARRRPGRTATRACPLARCCRRSS